MLGRRSDTRKQWNMKKDQTREINAKSLFDLHSFRAIVRDRRENFDPVQNQSKPFFYFSANRTIFWSIWVFSNVKEPENVFSAFSLRLIAACATLTLNFSCARFCCLSSVHVAFRHSFASSFPQNNNLTATADRKINFHVPVRKIGQIEFSLFICST